MAGQVGEGLGGGASRRGGRGRDVTQGLRARENGGGVAALGGGGFVAAEDGREFGDGVQAGAGLGQTGALNLKGFEIGEGPLDGGIAGPREQIEGRAAGHPGERSEVKALLDKDLQQAGVLGDEGGGLIRTGGDHMGNVRSLSGLSRALFGGAGIGHQSRPMPE